MSGVKKRSGRKGFVDEWWVKKILDKSYKMIDKALDDEDLPKEVRIEIARSFVLKAIPNKVENDSPTHQHIINNVLIKLDELGTDELRAIIQASRNKAIPERAA